MMLGANVTVPNFMGAAEAVVPPPSVLDPSTVNALGLWRPAHAYSCFPNWYGNGQASGIADGNNCGLMLDISRMQGKTTDAFLADQTNQISNGTFDTDLTGWSTTPGHANNSVSAVGGKCRFVNDISAGFANARLQQSLAAIQDYCAVSLKFDISNLVGSPQLSLWAYPNPYHADNIVNLTSLVEGPVHVLFPLRAATNTVTMLIDSKGTSAETRGLDIDNVEVKLIPGMHKHIRSTAQQKVWRENGGVSYLESDGIDDRLYTPRDTSLDWSDISWMYAEQSTDQSAEPVYASNIVSGYNYMFQKWSTAITTVTGTTSAAGGTRTLHVNDGATDYDGNAVGFRDAMANGVLNVAEYKRMQIDAANWPYISLSGYSGLFNDTNFYGMGIFETGAALDANRAALHEYLKGQPWSG